MYVSADKARPRCMMFSCTCGGNQNVYFRIVQHRSKVEMET